MTDQADRRRHYRSLALLDAKILRGAGEELPAGLKLATLDVGLGGVRCTSNVHLEPPTLLQMTLTLVGGELRDPTLIAAEARVLRCFERPRAPEHRRYEIALEFVRMAPEDRRRLERYVNSL